DRPAPGLRWNAESGREGRLGRGRRRPRDAVGLARAGASPQAPPQDLRVSRLRPADQLDQPASRRVLGDGRKERPAKPPTPLLLPPPPGARRRVADRAAGRAIPLHASLRWVASSRAQPDRGARGLARRGGHLLAHRLPGLARILHGAGILDRRDVAWIFVERDGPQYAPHDLAAARLREHGDKVEVADHCDRTHLAADRFEERTAQLGARLETLLEHDEGGDDLHTHGVWTRR